jgi:ATP adenylyltransferase
MERLWAPWRVEYVSLEQPKGCIFCSKAEEERDEENHLLWRGERVFILLNAFPYNAGHLLVAPYRHVGDPLELTAEEAAELLRGVGLALRTLKHSFRPQGFNIGANLGQVAGAGVAEHVHVHIVPRWSGDTNFMAVLTDTRVIPEGLDATYRRLREELARLLCA